MQQNSITEVTMQPKIIIIFFAWRDQQLVFWEDIINWVLKNMPKPKQARQSDQLSFQGQVSYQLIPFPIDYK